jgi:hypothetical protein
MASVFASPPLITHHQPLRPTDTERFRGNQPFKKKKKKAAIEVLDRPDKTNTAMGKRKVATHENGNSVSACLDFPPMTRTTMILRMFKDSAHIARAIQIIHER